MKTSACEATSLRGCPARAMVITFCGWKTTWGWLMLQGLENEHGKHSWKAHGKHGMFWKNIRETYGKIEGVQKYDGLG